MHATNLALAHHLDGETVRGGGTPLGARLVNRGFLEGVMLCAYGVQANAAYIYLRGEFYEPAQILQKALQETVKDPEFIDEADKAKIGLAPVTVDGTVVT